jgi:hypothetical protein
MRGKNTSNRRKTLATNMKRLLTSLSLFFLVLSFTTLITFSSTQRASASDFSIQDSSGFSVTEILSISEGESDESFIDGEVNITSRFIDQVKNNKANSVVEAVLQYAINILTILIGTFAFVMIIIGGFVWSTSSGDQSKVDRGKAILVQSILGLVFAMMSYFIVTFVLSFLYQ